jgi:glycosyltransferase involved in cell wall biosynthesis
MIMVYGLAIIITCFLILRLLVVFVNLISRPWLRARKEMVYPTPDPSNNNKRMGIGASPEKPLVSVLIPARNEAGNIGSLLRSLSEMRHPHAHVSLEVIVYDDMSDDNTADIVNEWCKKDSRIKLLSGGVLPAGWLGKNHACHQLAMISEGQYLLYLDADVIITKDLIMAALAHFTKYNLALLSLFPQQIMKSFGERITVPLMNWILVSLLPLILTRASSWPSFSAANGQFMLFDADIYHRHRFHEEVRHHKVEDILIFRMMKQKGMKVQTLLGNGLIRCRMYAGFKDAVQGFSKNVFEFFGNSIFAGMAFTLITTFGWFPIWMAWGYSVLGLYFVAVLLLRMLVALTSRQPLFLSIILAPLQQLAFIVVISVALYNKIRKKTMWKGRLIDR